MEAKRRITTMRIKDKNEEHRVIEIYEDDMFEFNYWYEGGSVIPRIRDVFDTNIEYVKLMRSIERTISILNLRNHI